MRICLRCGHNWRPRKDDPPVQCPSCRSPYWDRERSDAVECRKPSRVDRRVPGSVSADVLPIEGVPVGSDKGAGGDAKAVACPECHYLNGCHAKKCSKK